VDLPAPPPAPPPVPPPAPWTCRLTAVVRLCLRHGRPAVLAVVAYAETPVGVYGEALLAELRLPLRVPLRVTVPWIVVDSPASAAAGRRNWGLPKTVTQLDLALGPDAGRQRARVTTPSGELQLAARAVGPTVPVRGAAVLAQPGHDPAGLRFRGRARPAVVRVRGGPSPGAGPGAVLDGVLHLTASCT
jgi:hypothetical protein